MTGTTFRIDGGSTPTVSSAETKEKDYKGPSRDGMYVHVTAKARVLSDELPTAVWRPIGR